MFSLVQILSGIGLILFGVRFLRKGLDHIFGPRIERLLHRLVDRIGSAFAAGLGLGVAVPSSTSVSMLLLQPLQAGQLTARQLFPLVLGADIGLTTLVLLTSLQIDRVTPFLIILGVGLFQFTRMTTVRGVGQVFLSLAFIFLGVATIKAVGQEIATEEDLKTLVEIAQRYPVALALIAALLAVALQSSTAAILLVLSLGASVKLDLALAIPVVLGANLGVECTRLAIGWRLAEARRLALAMLLCKLLIAVAVGLASASVAQALTRLAVPFEFTIALTHTGFNTLVALFGLVTMPLVVRLASAAVAAPPAAAEQAFGPRYIGAAPIESSSLALGQSLREILRANEIVREMLDNVWCALEKGDEDLAKAVSQADDRVDLLDKEIKRFLTRIAGDDLDQDSAAEQMRQLRFMSEIEAIGDIIDKNLSELVLKKIRYAMAFSKEGWADLQDLFVKVRENMLIAEVAFQTRDRKLAAQLLRHKEWLNNYQRQLADRHLARLTAGLKESQETSAVHLDLLANLKRINSCVSHVAYAILGDGPASPAAPPAAGTAPVGPVTGDLLGSTPPPS